MRDHEELDRLFPDRLMQRTRRRTMQRRPISRFPFIVATVVYYVTLMGIVMLGTIGSASMDASQSGLLMLFLVVPAAAWSVLTFLHVSARTGRRAWVIYARERNMRVVQASTMPDLIPIVFSPRMRAAVAFSTSIAGYPALVGLAHEYLPKTETPRRAMFDFACIDLPDDADDPLRFFGVDSIAVANPFPSPVAHHATRICSFESTNVHLRHRISVPPKCDDLDVWRLFDPEMLTSIEDARPGAEVFRGGRFILCVAPGYVHEHSIDPDVDPELMDDLCELAARIAERCVERGRYAT